MHAATTAPLASHDFAAGLWRLADPKISLASIASLLLGAGAAARGGPLAPGWLAATALGIFAVEVAKNASGEIYDLDSGADLQVAPQDRSPFSGGKRVLVDGLLTRRETWAIALGSYALAIAFGLAIAWGREPRVLGLALAGGALAFCYHAPPLRLSYRGLGELAVALAYGPGIAAGTVLVQRGAVGREVVLASLPLGLLIAAFLIVNELPDAGGDLAAGKRTLVVRLGRRGGSRLFALVLAAAFGLAAVLPLLGLPPAVLLGLAGAVPALRAGRRALAAFDDTARLVAAQAQALLAFVLYAMGAGTGLVLAP
jgi:1,4-dihydroxy-2-naphthoate octaprenyltransferase